MTRTSLRAAWTSALTLMTLLALLAFPLAGTSAQTPTSTTFVSEQFGYQITWKEPWTLASTDSEANEYDLIVLGDGDATATIIFSRPGDTPLSQIVEFLVAGPDDALFVPGMVAPDRDGNEIIGETSDRAWGAWEGNYAGEEIDGFMEFRYGEIRRLDGDLAVGLSLELPATDFDGSVDAYSALLDGVTRTTATPGTAVATPNEAALLFDPNAIAPDSANLIFDPNVTIQDRVLITEAVHLAEDFYTARFAMNMGSDVTVSALPIPSPQDPYLIAATYRKSIVIYTQSLGWLELPPTERVRVVTHEYTHAYQAAKSADRQLTSVAWFEEGVAEYLSMAALSDLGLVDRDAMEGLFGSTVAFTPLPALQDLERYSAMQAQPGEVYPLAYFGVAQLMQNLPLTAIDAYYTELSGGTSFALAFERSFGIAPARFYDAFAEFRANGLPQMQEFPDELEIIEGIDLPSPVTPDRLPLLVISGEQSLIVAEAVPGANCTLDLMVAERSVLGDRRSTFTNGAGQVFWLLTIPDDVPTGQATVALACGADPLLMPVLIF